MAVVCFLDQKKRLFYVFKNYRRFAKIVRA